MSSATSKHHFVPMEQESDLGNAMNLPDRVKNVANLRAGAGNVIAWTKADPEHIGYYAAMQKVGDMLMVPCFWPLVLLMSPCLCTTYCGLLENLKSHYWILTEYDLIIVGLEFNICCWLPGICTQPSKVQSIPLEKITDCGIRNRGNGCINRWFGQVPVLFVDNASSSTNCAAAEGVGFIRTRKMMEKILDQRGIVLGRAGVGVTPAAHGMERGLHEQTAAAPKASISDRLEEVKHAYGRRLITETEYEIKRREILELL